MTIRHMKIFLSVCDHACNTTRAAEALHMTQPAVSLAIRELEQYYGVKLFDRIGRRLSLSPAGRQFGEYAAHISALFDDMEKGMRNWDSFGLLRVGASITVGSQFLPNYVKAFYNRFPGTKVKVLVAPSDDLEEKILKNELDLALMEGIAHNPALISIPYMEDRLAVICPANSGFRPGEEITLEVFRRQNLLLREPGSGTREVFDRAMAEAGITIEPVWEAMSTTALVNAVINGLGVAVLPQRMILGPLERGQVVPIRVRGLDFRRRFNLIYHREKFLTTSAKAFMDLCQNFEEDYPLPQYQGL